MEKSTLKRFHQAIIRGEDWQQVAIDLADGDEQLYDELCGAPDPSPECDCGACKPELFQD